MRRFKSLESAAPMRYMEMKEILAMVTIRTLSLTVLALVSGGGLLSPANAQRAYGDSPASISRQYQEPSTGGEIQLYSLPTGPAGKPTLPAESPVLPTESPAISAPPQPSLYPDPEPAPQAQYQRYPQYPDDAESPGWSPPGGSIKIEDYRGIRYASGGVGESERAELNSLSNQFNLRLLFAMQSSGDYLSDVRVNALDSRGGVVLSAQSNGPWFFAQLAPGTYTIEVGILDQTQRQTVRVDSSRQSQLNFYWR